MGVGWSGSIWPVDVPTDDPIFSALVALAPVIAGATELSVSMLPGGLSNTNYLVEADGERFVVRIGCENAAALGIDRTREEQAARLAHAAGFAPEVVVFTQPEGHSVVRFLPDARPPSIAEFVEPDMIARVAQRLRDVHALPRIEGRFDPFVVIDRWSEILDRRATPRPERLGALLELVDVARRERPAVSDTGAVLCHNDPYHLNFLDDGDLWLIDWEYAGMGDPMYDLAGVGLNLDTGGKAVLLDAYYGEATARLHRDLDLLIPVFLCWNTMWCLVQVEGAAVEFDFYQMAEDYLDMV